MTEQEKDIKSILRFTDYIVEEIEFKYNEKYEQKKKVKIDFDIDSNIFYNQGKDKAKVTLDVSVFKEPEKNNYPFYFFVRISGFFELQNIETEDSLSIMEKNTIAILFPYVRALISSFTANANVNPLILPPINVVKLIEAKKNN